MWTDANQNQLIEAGEKQTLLILAGYHRMTLWAINDLGTVVGGSSVADSDPPVASAVSWTNGAPVQFRLNMHLWLPAQAYGLPAGLNDLNYPWYSGGSSVIAADINEYGQIIGGGYYLWQEGLLTNVYTLLAPNSGWRDLIVEVINDHGDIVGRGNLNGHQRGFLLVNKWFWEFQTLTRGMKLQIITFLHPLL